MNGLFVTRIFKSDDQSMQIDQRSKTQKGGDASACWQHMYIPYIVPRRYSRSPRLPIAVRGNSSLRQEMLVSKQFDIVPPHSSMDYLQG